MWKQIFFVPSVGFEPTTSCIRDKRLTILQKWRILSAKDNSPDVASFYPIIESPPHLMIVVMNCSCMIFCWLFWCSMLIITNHSHRHCCSTLQCSLWTHTGMLRCAVSRCRSILRMRTVALCSTRRTLVHRRRTVKLWSLQQQSHVPQPLTTRWVAEHTRPALSCARLDAECAVFCRSCLRTWTSCSTAASTRRSPRTSWRERAAAAATAMLAAQRTPLHWANANGGSSCAASVARILRYVFLYLNAAALLWRLYSYTVLSARWSASPANLTRIQLALCSPLMQCARCPFALCRRCCYAESRPLARNCPGHRFRFAPHSSAEFARTRTVIDADAVDGAA